jgi:hypothetical protein
LNTDAQRAVLLGAITDADDASTPAGPTSDAASAASGSEVLRHEQECEAGVDLDFDAV